MRGVSQNAIDLIKFFEGLHKVEGDHIVPYKDAVGFWTIGYGHLLSRDRSAVNTWEPITEEYAEQVLLRNDLNRFEKGVIRLINVPLTDGQFGALVAFSFNLGLGSLQSSTLRKRVNEGEHEAAAEEFHRWIFAGGRKLRGLVTRRAAESKLYLS
jgi:lysozyme